MKKILILTSTILLVACSELNENLAVVAADEPESITLQISDSVGVEMGDENLTFGSIESMCYAPDGNIVLLDRAYSEVLIFTPSGDYIRSIGGQGDGPGEMNMTIYMGISQNGNLFVSQRSGINEFNYYTGEWVKEEQFNGPPPIAIKGATDSSFIAINMQMAEGDNAVGIDAAVSRFTDPQTFEINYMENSFTLNPTDMSNFFQEGWYGYCFDTDREGNVFISRSSATEYIVIGYSLDGTEFMRIEKEVIPLAKTDNEIQEEKEFLEARFESLGMGSVPYLPTENWNTVKQIGVDHAQRIWVQRGTEAVPTFDVFDINGNELFTATLPYPGEDGKYWRFSIEPAGILAWSENPVDGYQKFYIIPLV